MKTNRAICVSLFLALDALPLQGDAILTTLLSFGDPFGAQPNGLALAADSSLYGTTVYRGANNYGTVFHLTTNGVLITQTDVAKFAPCCALHPAGDLVERKYDGNFYGLTSNAVFRMPTNGALATNIAFLSENTARPLAGLVEGTDGKFYGTTSAGGTNGDWGTVFHMTFNGRITVLHSFANGDDGARPTGRLLLATDGFLYGTTSEGGANNGGTVFRISMGGLFAMMYSFSGGSDGYRPVGGLIEGANGILYGTTQYGGTNYVSYEGAGTVFGISKSSTFATVASFNGTNGAGPVAALIQAPDGTMYGTSAAGGIGFTGDPSTGFGTVFSVTTNGALATVFSFSGTNGANPQSSLVRVGNGVFYGTTYSGGTNSNSGTAFRLVLSPPPAPVFQTVARTASTITFTWSATPGQTYQVQYKTNFADPNWSSLGGALLSTNNMMTGSDGISPSPSQRFYRVAMLP